MTFKAEGMAKRSEGLEAGISPWECVLEGGEDRSWPSKRSPLLCHWGTGRFEWRWAKCACEVAP